GCADELILRRVNTVDGRKTAWVNDRRVSGEVLRGLSATLVELHGQHDDRGLLNPSGHRALLDAYAGNNDLIETVRMAWAERREARKALEEARASLAEMQAEEDFLRHAVAELERLAPLPGEEARLDQTRRLMQAGQRVREEVARAHAAVAPDAAGGLASDAIRWLDGAAEALEGDLDETLEALGRAVDALGEAEQGLSAILERLDVDPKEIETVEERLFGIRGLARKHGVAPDDLPTLAADLRKRLDLLDAGSKGLGGLEEAVVAAESAFGEAAQVLTTARTEAAKRLDQAMAAELTPLKMERAVFCTEISTSDPGPEGQDSVTFTVATNLGAPAGPLNQIASGGELSRFLLALKVCLTQDAKGLTMIFDEIDRGVGGATADAVGRRLKSLADVGQVLVVTHSPQVAALGGHHWRVEKHVAGGTTTSTVTPLAQGERVDELARMLAGDTVTDAARDAAKALLDG
ncbi:MAG: DNA repair protein RecN, partial [Pseudomonadota bacterium]